MKKKIYLVCIYFIIASCLATYPLIFHLSNGLAHDGDELFITWVLNWNIYSFFHNPLQLFNANIFYPYQNTLAYSETFLTASILGVIPWVLFREPLLVYNVLLLLAFSTLGFCTYLLVTHITKSSYAGIISGTLIAFSTYTITKTMHLQMIGIALVPLSIYFFILFAQTRKIHYFIFVCMCLFFQVANSFLPAYFMCFSFFFLWVSFYFSNKKMFFAFVSKKVFLITLVTILAMLPIVIPFIQVSQQFNHIRDIRDAIHFANRPEYTFYPSDRSKLQPFFLNTIYKHDTGPYIYDGYIGGMFFLLFSLTSIYYFAKMKKSLPYFASFLAIAIFSFILSLGPVWQWGGRVIKDPFMIPLPYALFYYIIPGFKGMRNSARWEMLFILAACVCIGIVMAYLFKNRLKKYAMLITIAICAFVLFEISLPMDIKKLPSRKEIPKMNYYINTLPHNVVVVEMPIYVWHMAPFSHQEFYRQYYSTVDFRKRMNGISGFSPKVWEEESAQLLTTFPSSGSIQLLKEKRITHVLVHANEYTAMNKKNYKVSTIPIKDGKTILGRMGTIASVRLVKKIGDDYLYKILYETN